MKTSKKILRDALHDIGYSKSLTATPAQFVAHLQKVAREALKVAQEREIQELVGGVHHLPDDSITVAVLEEHHGGFGIKAILVPPDQSLDFDPGTANRKWLWPDLGGDYHLKGFTKVTKPLEFK